MSSSLAASFLGALQASLSVLLTIGYGVVAAQFNLLKGSNTSDISKTCVRLFLPALLITNVGSELHLDTATRYVPILSRRSPEMTRYCSSPLTRLVVWSILYVLVSMLLGFTATRIFKLPSWVTPAICFNNTTALPLLLVQSLSSTGILEMLLQSKSDTTSDAVERAKSYFLVCAIVGNTLTFAVGPKLLDGEETPDAKEEESTKQLANGNDTVNGSQDVEQGENHNEVSAGRQQNDNASVNEQTSLLPEPVVRKGQAAGRKGYHKGKQQWNRLPDWAQTILDFMFDFLNAPLIGALLGALVGLVPALHRAFFSGQQNGGFLNAWLTTSLKNIGGLFATLQIIVVGVKLSSSLRKMKRGEDSGDVPWLPMLFVLIVRFVVWPV